ncbi:hypothetical protein QUF90_12760 [Desulfococcaceae bacterium HSG9]|nr:hypothetical protein [Desulfococcaceae bacterium HSG9]
MKSYIEKRLPIGFLSRLAQQESWRKEIYRPVYYIHKWWAKRLGSVFRGIVLGACAEDHDDFLNLYYRKNDFSDKIIFDPFMGSGVTIGEAIKMGCKVIGRDINPVSSTIVKASLNSYPINDVDSAFRTIQKNSKEKIERFFKTKLPNGDFAKVLYYFWVKFIECPFCHENINLFKSYIFSKNATPKKDPSARAICPKCFSINHTVFNTSKISCRSCNFDYNPQKGNVKGAFVNCPNCSDTFKLVDELKSKTEPLEHKLYAKLLLLPDGSKLYDSINSYDLNLYKMAMKEWLSLKDKLPVVPLKKGYNTNQVMKHNYKYWHQMFSFRQLVCISVLADEIRKISDIDLKMLFACLLSGTLEFNNMFCSFKGEGTGAVRHMFSHHILKSELMPIEANLWGTPKSSGSFSTLYKSRILRAINYKINPFEIKLNGKKAVKISNISKSLNCAISDQYSDFSKNGNSPYISQGDSAKTDIKHKSVDIIITDPPFFDNVHYSQLADFFYYWMNQILNISDKSTTRNICEVQDTEPKYFSEKLTNVFLECKRVLIDDGLLIFTYHHSKHEGWTAVYNAIRSSGFSCIQSYPVKAEMSVSMSIRQAKSPINLDLILVCKKEISNQCSPKDNNDKIYQIATEKAESQISELTSAGIKISVSDSKVAFMGRFLCELSKIGNSEKELKMLYEIEDDLDNYITDLLKEEKKSVSYEFTKEPIQLALFETMDKYLADRTLHRIQGEEQSPMNR